MVNSLQAQLLKAGLVDEKKLKQAQRAKKKAVKNTPEKVHDTAAAVEKARAEKAERDRQLNLQRQEEAARKEREAQAKQLIEQAKLDRTGGETAYQFVAKNKIKKIYVTAEQFDKLSRGKLGIVRLSGHFEVIPLEVAEKVAERAPHWPVIIAKVEAAQPDEDDPYADFKVPDDLMW
ncbi:nucleoprotein/polynucleotide-associated enzyme [Pseudomonas saudimassiliensis]|uniref:Nucleoprotein/polynucleotide-associated enzyme n=1 Tax=Pseudomonas saudimassiliensis TaxID=1461581 RepID=A0A078MGA7_9PSED|nr:DUF2058 domain-containing protein [Pseudomonas saudimassiliensis]CEA06363.1 nucleoprotein/polynucleotide-associated enzyme [Pseudomonas saudimassiliensis]CEF27788.1 nucleoprotein/polynucleotide-associated enzyme [Pseudomonas saudimassiliensis]